VFHDDGDDVIDDVIEKQNVDFDEVDFSRLTDLKETVIDASSCTDEEPDNSGVMTRLKKRRQPTKRRKQVYIRQNRLLIVIKYCYLKQLS